MLVREDVGLAAHTTLGVGGPARAFTEVVSALEVREAIVEAKGRGLPVRVLGAGSNILVPDEGVLGVVLRLSGKELRWEGDVLLADAGASWDDAVAEACAKGKWGIENLAGIPGTVGGAVIQNIGAYGAELSETFEYADTVRLDTGEEERVFRALDTFTYRDSVFKRERNRVIVRAAFRLRGNGVPNISYPDLARAKEAGISLSTPQDVARAVRSIREKKFPNASGSGTAGSFFKNPVLEASLADDIARRYPDLPRFLQPDGRVKISLAWLLDHALGLKGYARGFVRLYEKQPLVIVAELGASARDIDAFAEEIAARVRRAFAFELEREVETFVA